MSGHPRPPAGIAGISSYLSDLGQQVNPEATFTVLLSPDRASATASVVVLDLVTQDGQPPHCVHGYTTCMQCGQPVWLGHESERIVSSGEAYPICLPCATTDIPWTEQPHRHVQDHLRADGPHDD